MAWAFSVAVLFVIAGIVAALVIGRRIHKQISGSVKRFSDAGLRSVPVPLQGSLQISEIDAARRSLLWTSETVQKRVSEEQRARVEAVAANHAKDEFVSTLAHEVRTPLSAISIATEALDRSQGGPRPETAIIRRQLKHLSTLVNDLFDAGRVAMNKFVLVRQPMDLAEAVRSCVGTLSYNTSAAEIVVDATEVWIDGDETRIQQIVSNLITNAIKFTPDGGTVRLVVTRAGNEAILKVVDTGVGIPDELMPRIFDLFVQGERATADGMGIGLALCAVWWSFTAARFAP